MRVFVSLFAIILIATGIVGLNLIEDQQMSENRLMQWLRDFVALTSEEIPPFATRGGYAIQHKGRLFHVGEPITTIQLRQELRRKGVKPGDPTEIRVMADICSNPNLAYKVAIARTESQFALPGQPGMPEGSWTGLPIGEKSWATASKASEPGPGLGSSVLVVWDNQLVAKLVIQYQPIDPKGRTALFPPAADEDLESGELAARLILARASLVLLGWHELPKLQLVVNGSSLEARKHQRDFLIPVATVFERLGGKVERRSGILVCSWRVKRVTLPIGSRVALVGRWRVEETSKNSGVKRLVAAEGKVPLSHPVLFDGKEFWVDGEGIAKALGLRVQRKGTTVILVP